MKGSTWDLADYVLEPGEVVVLGGDPVRGRSADVEGRAMVVHHGKGMAPGGFNLEGEWWDQTNLGENGSRHVYASRYDIDPDDTALFRAHYGFDPEPVAPGQEDRIITPDGSIGQEDSAVVTTRKDTAKKSNTKPAAEKAEKAEPKVKRAVVEPSQSDLAPGDVLVTRAALWADGTDEPLQAAFVVGKALSRNADEITGYWMDQREGGVPGKYMDYIYRDDVDDAATLAFRAKYPSVKGAIRKGEKLPAPAGTNGGDSTPKPAKTGRARKGPEPEDPGGAEEREEGKAATKAEPRSKATPKAPVTKTEQARRGKDVAAAKKAVEAAAPKSAGKRSKPAKPARGSKVARKR